MQWLSIAKVLIIATALVFKYNIDIVFVVDVGCIANDPPLCSLFNP